MPAYSDWRVAPILPLKNNASIINKPQYITKTIIHGIHVVFALRNFSLIFMLFIMAQGEKKSKVAQFSTRLSQTI